MAAKAGHSMSDGRSATFSMPTSEFRRLPVRKSTIIIDYWTLSMEIY
jgi:hypothetical protein